MRNILGACFLFCSFVAAPDAEAAVRIHIDLSSQTMHVDADGASYNWAVSTARSGYATPRGHYRATHLQLMHYSHKYHMSPMPHSIFFNGGYAIHGTYSTAQLGRPASHGCVRLSPGNAARLYGMVQREGASITISGAPPRGAYAGLRHRRGAGSVYAARRTRSYGALAYAPMRRGPVAAGAGRIIDPLFRSPAAEGYQ